MRTRKSFTSCGPRGVLFERVGERAYVFAVAYHALVEPFRNPLLAAQLVVGLLGVERPVAGLDGPQAFDAEHVEPREVCGGVLVVVEFEVVNDNSVAPAAQCVSGLRGELRVELEGRAELSLERLALEA